MKRYIRYIHASSSAGIVDPSMFSGTPFTYEKASGYEDYLNPDTAEYYSKHKNREGKIVMMTPTEYVNECVKIFNNRTTFDSLIDQRTDEYLPQYEEAMRKGDKFPLCYIDYYTHGQEGLHRMIAAGNVFGWNTKFPVLVVSVKNQEQFDLDNAFYECNRFLKYGDFDQVCRKAVDEYIEYNIPLPDDFESELRKTIVNVAKHYEDGYDIDVAVEVTTVNKQHIAYVYLTRYGVYDIPNDDLADPYEITLDYFYDFGEDTYVYDKSIDDEFDDMYDAAIRQAEEQGIDLDDYDSIMKLFFREK